MVSVALDQEMLQTKSIQVAIDRMADILVMGICANSSLESSRHS